MNIAKAGFNILVECDGRIGKSSVCSNPVRKINFTGIKYAPAIEKDTVQFTTKPITKIKGTNIEAIASEKEYDQVLEKLKKQESWFPLWNVENADKYEQGLMPYAGIGDICHEINTYIRTGKLSKCSDIPEETMKDYIRVLDYSLGK